VSRAVQQPSFLSLSRFELLFKKNVGRNISAMHRWCFVLLLLLCAVLVQAQRRSGYRGGRADRRAAPPQVDDLTWTVDPKFKKDVFTFVRIRYQSNWGWEKWQTDWPDSDQNFSFRLQQVTALKVNPNPVILELTDKELFQYPWIYIVEPGRLVFSDDEVAALKKYLLGGGFLMVDDFWGVDEYENFHQQIKRVFPDKEPQELPFEHPIFNCVFPLKQKLAKKPQIPNIYLGIESEQTHITWERPDAVTPEYKGVFDDNGRMMVIICHNTDLGDGWEREGESEYYFREFSEKQAYPLGINIVFYAMTH
jgi:hypothetical protein